MAIALPPHRSSGWDCLKPSDLLRDFVSAKEQHNLGRMQEICKTLQQGWSRAPVWQQGYNKLSYQRQRLSPYASVSSKPQDAFYKAYMQVILDPALWESKQQVVV